MKEIGPYDFRRTFVGALLDAVGGLSAAQKLAGHFDPAPARYDPREGRAVRQAASHLHGLHVDKSGSAGSSYAYTFAFGCKLDAGKLAFFRGWALFRHEYLEVGP
jgi:hypothetical protein